MRAAHSNTTVAALGMATAEGDDNCDYEVSEPVSFDIVTETDGSGLLRDRADLVGHGHRRLRLDGDSDLHTDH